MGKELRTSARGCLMAMPGGRLDNPFDPSALMSLEDAVRTLSHVCRWNGHGCRFYSVLDHSLTLAAMVPEKMRAAALVHDFAEAYTGDIPHPVKRMPEMAWFREMEARLDARVWKHYAGVAEMPSEVIKLDQELAVWEARWLGLGGDWAHPALLHVNAMRSCGWEEFRDFAIHLECGGEIGKMTEMARESSFPRA